MRAALSLGGSHAAGVCAAPMRAALIALSLALATSSRSPAARVSAGEGGASVSVQAGAPGRRSGPLRRLLQLQLRSREAGSARDAARLRTVARRKQASPLPERMLPVLGPFEKRRACRELCTKASGGDRRTMRVCLKDCNKQVNYFEWSEQKQQGKQIDGEAVYEWDEGPCFPVADVNVVGLPSFEEFDVRQDDVLDFEEMALYAFLLCIPKEAVSDLFHSLDHDQDDLVCESEWEAMDISAQTEVEGETSTTTTTKELTEEEYLDKLSSTWNKPISPPSFNSMDMDGDNKLQPHEFAGGFMNIVMNENPSMGPMVRSGMYEDLTETFFPLVDTDGDHFVSQEEWDHCSTMLGAQVAAHLAAGMIR